MLDHGLADVAFIRSERRNMFVPHPILIRARYNLPIFNVHGVVCVPSRLQDKGTFTLHILNPFLIPAALTDKSETFLEKGSGNKNNGDFKQSKGKRVGGIIFFTH